MNIEESHKALKDLVYWISENSTGISLLVDRRSQIASGCLDVALEHQAAILLLCQANLYGSMLAMFRVITESVVRGLWILLCASEQELEQYENGRIKKQFGVLIEEIERQLGESSQTISQLKSSAWNAMNGFTHTGYLQVTRRYKADQLGSNYLDMDVIQCLNASGVLGLIASAQLVIIAGRNDLVDKHINKMSEYTRRTEGRC